jgi:hypothetical protein
MATESGRNICKEQLLIAYDDKHTATLQHCNTATIIWGNVALAYREMGATVHISLKQDFGHFWLWRKNK